MAIIYFQDAIQSIHHCLSLINLGSNVFTRLHVAAAIKFQAQLEERLLAPSNALVTQTREQARAISEEAHATTLAPRLQFFETLLQEVRCSLNKFLRPLVLEVMWLSRI